MSEINHNQKHEELLKMFWWIAHVVVYMQAFTGGLFLSLLVWSPRAHFSFAGLDLPFANAYAWIILDVFVPVGLLAVGVCHFLYRRLFDRKQYRPYISLLVLGALWLTYCGGVLYNTIELIDHVGIVEVEVEVRDKHTKELLSPNVKIFSDYALPTHFQVENKETDGKKLVIRCVGLESSRFQVSADGYTEEMVSAKNGEKVVVELLPAK